MNERKGKAKPAAALFILMLICSITLSGCSHAVVKTEASIRNVSVEKAVIKPISVNEEYAGRITPSQEINVASTISGRVDKVFFDVGQAVNKGQTLFTLQVDAQQTNAAEAAVKQAQLQSDYAQNLYEKTKSLFSNGAVSQQELDNVEKEYNSALVQLNSARDNLALITGSSSTGSAVNSVITAPISGIISVCNVDPGEMTSTSTAAFTIIDPKDMYIEINVSDKNISMLAKDQKLKVVIDALNKAQIEGRVDRISPNVDPKTKLYTVRIVLSQANEKISAGMFARVFVPIEYKAKALQIPNQALVVEQGADIVYTVEKGIIKKRVVKIGIAAENGTEITGNLKAGDDVVIDGQQLLQEGDKVHVVRKQNQ